MLKSSAKINEDALGVPVKFPALFMLASDHGCVVMFASLTEGTVVHDEKGDYLLWYTRSTWTPCTTDNWVALKPGDSVTITVA